MNKIFLILSAALLVSCQSPKSDASNSTKDNSKVTIHKEFDIDGKLHSTMEVSNGKVNGWGTTYYPDGKVMTKCRFKEGIPVGKETMYYKSGKVYRIIPFENGKKQGWVEKYYRNGKLKSRQFYQEGMPGTTLEEFDSRGKKVTDYPHITYRIVRDRDYKKQKLLLFEMSNHSPKVTFYEGELVDSKYFNLNEMPTSNQNGVGEIILQENFTGSISIVAKLPTPFRNSYVTHVKAKIE